MGILQWFYNATLDGEAQVRRAQVESHQVDTGFIMKPVAVIFSSIGCIMQLLAG
jgi:hypothetical protein